jgi:SAM-dependent methyltransferase
VTDDFTRGGVQDYAQSRYRKPDQRWVHRREEALILGYLQRVTQAGGRVLDVPCGYGRFVPLLMDSGFRIAGSDLSLSMVQEMRHRFAQGPETPWGVVGDAVQGLPFRSAAFSGVVSIRLFQHLHLPEERQAALHEFARLSRDFVIMSYYRWNALHVFQRRLRRRLKPQQASICMASRSDMLGCVRRAGLEVVAEDALLPGLHAQHFLLLRRLKPVGEAHA